MSEAGRSYRFIISGGGTGGHIYPALAVANEIKRRHESAEILFVGAEGKMEMQKVPEAGYPIKGLWISGLQRRLTTQNLLFPVKLIHSWLKARKILNAFKPDAVLGFGGFASGPIMLAATGKSIPSLVQEQNSYAGLTNRKLGDKVQRICVAYDNMERYFPADKITLTGNPVRKDILDLSAKRNEGLKHFGLREDAPVLLVIGGSLGARSINNAMVANLQKLASSGVQVIWQTGRIYFEEMKGYATEEIHVHEFIRHMDLAYAAADVVISRAGALSISELCLAGRPVVFVPSANVAEDHQTKNAMALVNKDAAIMVKDSDASEKMVDEALRLLADEEARKKLAVNIRSLGKPRATEEIVNELEKLIA